MKSTALAFLLAVTIFFPAPAFAAKNDSSVQVKGSDTMVNLVQAWAEAFMEERPNAFIAVTGGGTGTGFAALINGTCDLAMASREIKPTEIELARKKGVEPKEFKPALDGLAVVVHPSNPVSELTVEQLAAVFTGKIRNWKELGGQDVNIVVLSREVNSGTHVYFKEHVLRGGKADSKEEFSPDALLMPSSQAIADETANNSGAIGYFGMGYLAPSLKAVSVAQKAGEPAVPPTVENVISGAYPISRPLYIYSKGEAAGEAKALLDFMLSDKGQALVEENDFVPVKNVTGA